LAISQSLGSSHLSEHALDSGMLTTLTKFKLICQRSPSRYQLALDRTWVKNNSDQLAEADPLELNIHIEVYNIHYFIFPPSRYRYPYSSYHSGKSKKRVYRSPAPTIANSATTPANTPSWSFGAAPDLKVANVLEDGATAFGDTVVELAAVGAGVLAAAGLGAALEEDVPRTESTLGTVTPCCLQAKVA
jgi:hypothetical protein